MRMFTNKASSTRKESRKNLSASSKDQGEKKRDESIYDRARE